MGSQKSWTQLSTQAHTNLQCLHLPSLFPSYLFFFLCSLSTDYRACSVERSVVLFSQPAQPKLEAVDSEWSSSKYSVKYSLENLPGPSSSHSDEPLCDPKLVSACTYWMLEIFLVAQTVKNMPAVWETQVGSLGQEDPLEKEMATHSSILAWKIPWTEEPSKLQSMGSQRVGHDWATSLHWMLSSSWCSLACLPHHIILCEGPISSMLQTSTRVGKFTDNGFRFHIVTVIKAGSPFPTPGKSKDRCQGLHHSKGLFAREPSKEMREQISSPSPWGQKAGGIYRIRMKKQGGLRGGEHRERWLEKGAVITVLCRCNKATDLCSFEGHPGHLLQGLVVLSSLSRLGSN